jgi:hypothetical protein
MNRCDDCARLTAEIDAVLKHLVELTTGQLEAFRAGDNTVVARLDKELEHAVGRKERAFGAQREHAHKHGVLKVFEEQ